MALDLSALDDAPFDAPLISVPSEKAAKAPLSEFMEDPNNPRTEFNDPEFENFVADIRQRGILQPIVVQLFEGKKLIRFGARRYRAACVLQLSEVPYIVTDDERQLDDYAQVAENESRLGLSPLDLAKFMAKKIAEGEKKKEVAANLKIDPSSVTHHLSMLDAPPFVLELYHSRKCRAPHWLYELKKLHARNPEIVERRCAEAEDIDRRLLVAIASEIEPKQKAQTEEATNVQDVLDQSGGNSGGETLSSEEGFTSPENTEIQIIPPHNPDIEKTSDEKLTDPEKIKKPLLLGLYAGREVMIRLNKRPTAAGLIFVKYEDGSGEDEVSVSDVSITLLSEAQKA